MRPLDGLVLFRVYRNNRMVGERSTRTVASPLPEAEGTQLVAPSNQRTSLCLSGRRHRACMAPPRLAKPVMPGLWVLTFGHGADSRKPVAPTIPGGDMVMERPARRMTLRQLLTHSEKCTRDLVEHFQTTVLTRITDFRDL